MKARRFPILGASVLMLCLLCACGRAPAEQTQGRMVRLSEIEIDPAQLENYKAELREEIEASIRLEPGVLTLYAVSLKNSPTSIRILETYADVDAYKAHISIRLISKNTRPIPRKWLSLSNLLRPIPFRSARSEFELKRSKSEKQNTEEKTMKIKLFAASVVNATNIGDRARRR